MICHLLACLQSYVFPHVCRGVALLCVPGAGMKRRRVSNACIFTMPCQKDRCYAAGVAAGCFVYIITKSLLVACYLRWASCSSFCIPVGALRRHVASVGKNQHSIAMANASCAGYKGSALTFTFVQELGEAFARGCAFVAYLALGGWWHGCRWHHWQLNSLPV